MIQIHNVDVFGWEAAIRGMRNPMNSWDKSDSFKQTEQILSNGTKLYYNSGIGDDDFRLMKKLVAAGTDHSKFMRMINVTADIKAPLYWWKEFDTYKVGTVANSCSTMHKIQDKPFTLDDFSREHLLTGGIYQLERIIDYLNDARDDYNRTKDKLYWWNMIQLLPSSYNQLRTVQLNYAVLRNIYHARKEHKLDEWREFCKWVDMELPYSELITM